ncbi:MAG TPA: helix-turn-helix transcriptional regulator [Symbiobacteriaceae bacterium]|nr:helix-turn-helix transcriptional regulator [Symbiobacteriaceae bacterium]
MSLFGAYIKHIRTEKGLTLRGAAELMGVDPSSLSRLERGEVVSPSEELLVSMATALDRAKPEVYLAAGRITPGLASKLEQGMPIGLFHLAKFLDTLEREMADALTPAGSTPLMQHLKPGDAETVQNFNDALFHLSEITDGILQGSVTPSQFGHVVENIRQLKLALLDKGEPSGKSESSTLSNEETP